MRTPLLLALLLIATPCRAGVLTSATLEVEILNFAPAVTFVAASPGGSAAGPLSGSLAAGSAFAGAQTTLIFTAPPLTQLQIVLTGNQLLPFSGATPGAVGGTGTFFASARPKAYLGSTLLFVPLTFGRPGTVAPSPAYGVILTVFANAWTAGATTLSLTTPTYLGGTLFVRTGSNALTPSGSGTIQLVTAILIQTNLTPPLATFATLTLHFVPEPGAALLALAAAALVAWGRRTR